MISDDRKVSGTLSSKGSDPVVYNISNSYQFDFKSGNGQYDVEISSGPIPGLNPNPSCASFLLKTSEFSKLDGGIFYGKESCSLKAAEFSVR